MKANYAFDATNMMTAADITGAGRAEYTYNGLRSRVRKFEDPQDKSALPDPARDIRYILDMTRPYDNLLMTQGTQNQSFVWGNDLIRASGDESCYYLQDHLGSPIRLMDGGSDTKLAGDAFGLPLAYDTFGAHLAGGAGSLSPAGDRSGKGPRNPFGFTGYQMDDVTGLYCAQARYYAPGAGRFTGEDIIKGLSQIPRV
jgi:RHS repeat-associated protein